MSRQETAAYKNVSTDWFAGADVHANADRCAPDQAIQYTELPITWRVRAHEITRKIQSRVLIGTQPNHRKQVEILGHVRQHEKKKKLLHKVYTHTSSYSVSAFVFT